LSRIIQVEFIFWVDWHRDEIAVNNFDGGAETARTTPDYASIGQCRASFQMSPIPEVKRKMNGSGIEAKSGLMPCPVPRHKQRGHNKTTPTMFMGIICNHLEEARLIAKTPTITIASVTMAPGSSNSFGTPAISRSSFG